MSRSTRATGGAFSPAVMVIMLLVSIVALAGLGVLSAYTPELRSGNNGGGHALSRASIGFGGLPPLLRGLDIPVVLKRDPQAEAQAGSLLVLTPSSQVRSEQLSDLESQTGPTLIVLPKWVAAPYQGHPGWVRTVDNNSLQATLYLLPKAMRKGTSLTEHPGRTALSLYRPSGAAFGAPVQVESLRTLSGAGWTPVVVDAQGAAVLAMHSATQTYVLTDPDLINTQGLKTLAGAKTAVALLGIIRGADTPVVFDLTLHGFQKSRNLLRLLLEPPLLGMTLALVALAALAGFHAAVRFGPPREKDRTIALGKTALAENTAGLVRMARREHHMAAPYALLIRAAAARAIGAPRTLSDGALDGFLDRVSKITGATDTYSALAEQARAAKTPGDLLRVAGALHRWNQELTRARQ